MWYIKYGVPGLYLYRTYKIASEKARTCWRVRLSHEKVLSRNFIRKRVTHRSPKKKYEHFACTLLFAMKIGNEQYFSSVVVVPPGCLLMKNDGNYFHFLESFFFILFQHFFKPRQAACSNGKSKWRMSPSKQASRRSQQARAGQGV